MSLLFSIAGPPPHVYVGMGFVNLDRIADDKPFRRDLSEFGVKAMLLLTHNSLGLPKQTYMQLVSVMVEREIGPLDLNAVVLDLDHGNLKRLRRGKTIVRDYTGTDFPVPFRLTLIARETEQDLYIELRDGGITVPDVTFGTDGSPLRPL